MFKKPTQDELKKRRKRGPSFYAKYNEFISYTVLTLPLFIIAGATPWLTYAQITVPYILMLLTCLYTVYSVKPYMENYEERAARMDKDQGL